MIEMIIEVIEKARRVYAVAFVLLIAFCIAQGAVIAGVLPAALSFLPVEVLSLIVTIYWLSYVTVESKIFDKIIGE